MFSNQLQSLRVLSVPTNLGCFNGVGRTTIGGVEVFTVSWKSLEEVFMPECFESVVIYDI